MKHIGFCLKIMMVIIVLILTAGEVVANTGVDSSAFVLSEENSIKDIPLTGCYAISAAIGRDRDIFHVRAAGSDHEAVNPKQTFTARFSSSGVGVSLGGYSLGLEILGFGYGEDLKPIAPGRPEVVKNRVEYHRGTLAEWYVNGPFGLQQGFTLKSAPSDRGVQTPLTLFLRLRSDLRAVVAEDRKGLVLSNAEGIAVIRYRGLTAIDADGREAPAWMETKSGNLFLRVDDTNARYPLMIDPIIQTAKLTASDGAANDEFGCSVSISGDTIVVGASGDDITFNEQGSAYVFEKDATWATTSTYTAKLTASDGEQYHYFGHSVSISGDTIVVGASQGTGILFYTGAVYVFVKPGTGWTSTSSYTAKLTASDGAGFDHFGTSVSVSGDTIVVGAYNDNIGDNDNQGSAYVFVKPGAGWGTPLNQTETAKLTASDGEQYHYFGRAVSVINDTIVVGATRGNGINSNMGAVYVFVKPGTGWATTSLYTAKLTASDGADGDEFGASVSVINGTIVVGAKSDDMPDNDSQGSAYVFVEPVGGWEDMTETAKLTASDGAGFDHFGTSVSVSGDTIVVGANGDDMPGKGNQGSAYVFVEPVGGWEDMTETAKLTASDGADGDEFGASVSVINGTIVVGAHGDDIDANANQGSAYVFNVNSTTIPALELLLLSSIEL